MSPYEEGTTTQDHLVLDVPLNGPPTRRRSLMSRRLQCRIWRRFRTTWVSCTSLVSWSSPSTDSPTGGMSPERLNDFECVHTDGTGDPKGTCCPVGAHMRRVNPRGSLVAGQGQPGGSNNSHRLIRRGLPYGPTYDPTKPYDGIERGMLFHFINSNIRKPVRVRDAAFGSMTANSLGPSGFDPKSKDPLTGTQRAQRRASSSYLRRMRVRR